LIEAATKRNNALLVCLTRQERKVFDEAFVKLSTLSRARMAAEQTGPIARAVQMR